MMKLKVILMSAVLTLSACSGNVAKDYQRGTIPKATKPNPSKIAQTKSLLHRELAKNKIKLYQSGPQYNRVKRIVNRLSHAAGLGGWSYPVYMADSKQVNAMAVNDNTIVVFKKLADNIGNDDDLMAVVLGHEVSHILSHHGSDRVAQNRTAGVAIGAEILGAIIAHKTGSAELGQAGRDITGTIGLGAWVRPYGRSMELEADHVGMLLMAKAGYDPRAAIRFWNNSGKYLGTTSGRTSFLSTHPDPGNRKAQLQATLPTALKYYRK
jgi:metalloendopeptidase OMA1, mitochondrial